MSARNGDKARFGCQRKRKMVRRQRMRALQLTAPAQVKTGEVKTGEANQPAEPHHAGILESAAQKIGSAIGVIASKTGLAEHSGEEANNPAS